MPASLDRIRSSMKVAATPKDKGLVLTLTVVAYDTGMVMVDGIPINTSPSYDQGEGWAGAAEVTTATLSEFRRQVAKRQAVKQKQSGV